MTQVELLALTKRFPGRDAPVLKNLSLTISDGELVALLGQSGSGKSTLLKLIAGIERPDAGDIRLDGDSILTLPPHKRGTVFMFQKSYLFPFLTVAENIGFGLKVKGTPAGQIRDEVAQMLALVGLPDTENRRPAQLSGGEQQRVALARALVTRPKVLLLDEPLSSLDSAARLNLQAAIRSLQRALGITTILVTHDVGEAMAMSDRLALLQGGEIIAVDRPEQLFHHPPSVPAAQFMGVSTFLVGRQSAAWLEMPQGRLQTPHCGQVLDAVKSDRVAGDTVTYAIRPEHIRIQADVGHNTLAGTILDSVFRGEHIEYLAVVGDLQVRARMSMPAPMFAPGAAVHVGFPAQHLFRVRDR